jgi:hypothetical protein
VHVAGRQARWSSIGGEYTEPRIGIGQHIGLGQNAGLVSGVGADRRCLADRWSPMIADVSATLERF